MITGVDGGVTGLRLILTSDGESGVEIGKTPRGEGRTASHKLNEGLPLVRIQLTQDRDKPLESRAVGETKRKYNIPLNQRHRN